MEYGREEEAVGSIAGDWNSERRENWSSSNGEKSEQGKRKRIILAAAGVKGEMSSSANSSELINRSTERERALALIAVVHIYSNEKQLRITVRERAKGWCGYNERHWSFRFRTYYVINRLDWVDTHKYIKHGSIFFLSKVPLQLILLGILYRQHHLVVISLEPPNNKLTAIVRTAVR